MPQASGGRGTSGMRSTRSMLTLDQAARTGEAGPPSPAAPASPSLQSPRLPLPSPRGAAAAAHGSRHFHHVRSSSEPRGPAATAALAEPPRLWMRASAQSAAVSRHGPIASGGALLGTPALSQASVGSAFAPVVHDGIGGRSGGEAGIAQPGLSNLRRGAPGPGPSLQDGEVLCCDALLRVERQRWDGGSGAWRWAADADSGEGPASRGAALGSAVTLRPGLSRLTFLCAPVCPGLYYASHVEAGFGGFELRIPAGDAGALARAAVDADKGISDRWVCWHQRQVGLLAANANAGGSNRWGLLATHTHAPSC